jgi:hypothetical protein
MHRLSKAALLGSVALSLSSPALAHHAGPTGIGGNGGGLAVYGPETLEAGKGAVGLQVTYLRTGQRPDTVLEDLAAQEIHAHDTDYILNAAFGVAYGLTDRLTMTAELPYVRRQGLREGEFSPLSGGEITELGDVAGIGDMSLLAKYRLVGGSESGFALIGGIKFPTGSTHAASADGERLETEHQPGSGSWDYYLGGAFGTEFGWVSLDASLLYQLSTTGAQSTRLGDRLQAGIALSHSFGPPEHHHDEDEEHGEERDEHRHQSWGVFIEAVGEWEGRQRVAGAIERDTGGTALWLTPGVRFNSASGLSLTAAAGIPVWQDIRPAHADNRLRLTLALSKAF